jgi:hypothetical protein
VGANEHGPDPAASDQLSRRAEATPLPHSPDTPQRWRESDRDQICAEVLQVRHYAELKHSLP